jgi:type II secretory pathway pseudopilin PulG
MKQNSEQGFTYIEVMCAIVILMVGILAQLSAMSLSMLRQRESEKQTAARQLASSTLESIFAARDLGNTGGLSSFAAINTTDVHTNGLFLPGWNPVREDSGKDGIHGTADDACLATIACTVGGYTNNAPVSNDFERRIIITDIVEAGKVKKRRVEVKIRFFVGQLQREQSLATIIADLPFYQ